MKDSAETRDSFIFYRSFYEAINTLPKENQLEIYNAIFQYSLNFDEIELSGLPKAIFTLIKPNLEANRQRYLNGKKPKTKQKISEAEAKDKQNGSEVEAKDKRKISETEANKDVNVNENIECKSIMKKNSETEFDKFWNLYDYKVSKPKAEIAYKKV